MDKIKYIGLDVHRDTISAAVLNESGRLIQQSVLMTRVAVPRMALVEWTSPEKQRARLH